MTAATSVGTRPNWSLGMAKKTVLYHAFTSYDHSDFALHLNSPYRSNCSQKTVPGEVMPNPAEQGKKQKLKKSNWWCPAEAVNSLAGAVVVAFRGCWHGRMSWPVGVQGYSYQVCLSCGAKRLFDEN